MGIQQFIIGVTARVPLGASLLTTPGQYSFNIPAGTATIRAVTIGGGGGGGGGTARTNNDGRWTGGAGGGAGGCSTASITLFGGQKSVSVQVGERGAGGDSFDPGSSSISHPGASGATSSVSINGTLLCSASGGAGGGGSALVIGYTGYYNYFDSEGNILIGTFQGVDSNQEYAHGGTYGDALVGTSLFSGRAGGVSYFAQYDSGSGLQTQANGGGGFGGAGYFINFGTRTVTRDVNNPGGVGNDAGAIIQVVEAQGNYTLTHADSTGIYVPTVGVSRGCGGGGGGKDNEYWGNSGAALVGAPGSSGAVFVWWE